MEEGDEPRSECEKLLKESDNCRRLYFRFTKKMQPLLKELIYALGYQVDGYSIHDIVRAVLLDNLERYQKDLSPEAIRERIAKMLKKYTPNKGRPRGSPNRHVTW